MKPTFFNGPLGLLLFITAALMSMIAFAPSTSAAVIAQRDVPTSVPVADIEARSVPPASWFFVGLTTAQITSHIREKNARITVLRIEDPTVPTFAVSLVENTGDFATSWWWYFGIEETQVSSFLSKFPASSIRITLDSSHFVHISTVINVFSQSS